VIGTLLFQMGVCIVSAWFLFFVPLDDE